MARRKHGVMMDEDEPELDISSLIDVCFLLLIYFIVTQTIQPRESDIALMLPSGVSTTPAVEYPPMLIEVQDSGAVLLNKVESLDLAAVGQRRVLPQLKARLEIYKEGTRAAGAKPMVQVAVRGDAPNQSVVDVLNCLVGVGIDQVTFTDF